MCLHINIVHPHPIYQIVEDQKHLGTVEYEDESWTFRINVRYPALDEQQLRFIADKIKSLG